MLAKLISKQYNNKMLILSDHAEVAMKEWKHESIVE